jgi:hypothetical protein
MIGQGGVPAEVRTVEPLGAETAALLEVDGHELHALLAPADRLEPGATTMVAARPGALLYFDRAGVRLDASRAPTRDAARERAYVT